MNNYVDPLDALDNPEIHSPEYFGQLKVETWFCVLEKGVGKVTFDPQKHGLDRRRTAVKIGLIPLPEHNIQNRDIYRDHIAESKEWAALVLPSIKGLGISARELDGKWVKLTFQNTGRTYSKTDPMTGETTTRDATTFKFLALYPNEAACRAAYEAEHNGNGSNGNGHNGNGASAPAQSAAPTNGNGNPVNHERETAAKFIKPLIVQANGDAQALATKLATMNLTAKYFTVDSPEVVEALAQYQFEQMSK